MAIYSAVPPPPGYGVSSTGSNAAHDQHQQQQPEQPEHPTVSTTTVIDPASGTIDIEAWTVSALQSLSVSPEAKGSPLAISLDAETTTTSRPSVRIHDPRKRGDGATPPPRPPSRRDSQRRRELLLKGKEGSRQRRRWENDRLVHVPGAVPPEPADWEPRPTHPVHHVPYSIASAWDQHVRAEVEKKRAVAARRKQQQTKTLGDDKVAGRVPRELFVRAKKTPAVKGWVMSLEEPIRRFLVDGAESSEETEEDDEDEEEIVFHGRSGAGVARDGWKRAKRQGQGHAGEMGMVFDALGDDEESSAFKRWLTHSISDYYGLDSRSVLVGNPGRKVVYVGARGGQMKTGHRAAAPVQNDLPRPLWQLC